MPVASGSIAYLGAARFQGFWNASNNTATGSNVATAPTGNFDTLFTAGTSVGGGYSPAAMPVGGISASAGDYWQVSVAGSTNVDSMTDWGLNDWVIYSGSAGGSGTWLKLAYEDTITSIILGDLSSGSLHMGAESDKHVIFTSGSNSLSGTNNFTFDYINNNLLLTGNLNIGDDKKMYFGASNDASLEYDEDGTDELRFAGAAVTFEQNVTFDNDVTLGVAATDVTTVTGRLTASQGAFFSEFAQMSDDKKIYLGTHFDASIEYDEDGSNMLIVSGAFLGTQVTGAVHFGGGDGHLYMTDDKKFYFGNNSDTFIEYDEDHTNLLIISGSSAGAVISGSNVTVVSKHADFYATTVRLYDADLALQDDKRVYFGDDSDAYIEYDEAGNDTAVLGGSDWLVLDDKKLYFGSDKDSHIEYNEDHDNFLVISGSAQGVAISGSKLYFVSPDSNFVGASLAFTGTDLYLQDDKKINFGNTLDSYIKYDENKDDFMVISGSAKGIALSGSHVNVFGKLGVGTFAPAYDLEVAGNALITGNLIVSGTLDAHVEDFKVTANTVTLGDGSGDLTHVTGNFSVSGSTVFGNNDGVTTTHQFSGSLYVADDEKILFGANEDASIHYDEANINKLVVTGSVEVAGDTVIRVPDNTGMAFSVYEGANQYINVITTDGNESIVLSKDIWVTDDIKLYFGTGKDAYFEYDEDGTDTLLYAGADLRISDDVKLEFGTGGDAAIEYDEDGSDMLIVSGAFLGTQITGGIYFGGGDGDLHVSDDKKLYFGNNDDASIEYDEAGSDLLVLSGSSAGMVLSGSAIDVSGSLQLKANSRISFLDATRYIYGAGTGMYLYNEGGDIYFWTNPNSGGGHIRIADDVKMYFGSASDSSIEYDENGSNTLIVSGAFLGTQITGGIYFGGGDGDLHVADDKKLYFGNNDDAFVEYAEAEDDYLIISGSTKGIGLSGSLVHIVDKLQVGPTNAGSAKTSGILVVDAAAADTTNGLIATFKSSDSDYGRINIDNSTANGDTQFTFMSNGSSKWSVGNQGSDETFHIKSGFGDFTDSDPLVLTTTSLTFNTTTDVSGSTIFGRNDGVTTTHQFSGSIYIADDKSIVFGTNNNASIEYDEDGTDELRFAGAAVTFEQDVTFDNDVTLGVAVTDVTTVTGRLTASKGMLVSDDERLYFGSGADAYIEYDEAGNDTAVLGGTNWQVLDDKKLYFGDGLDAHIEYDEDGWDRLAISGSKGGLNISGSSLYLDPITVTSGTVAGPGSYLGVTTAGAVVLSTTPSGGGGGSARSVAGDTDNGMVTWVTSDDTFAVESSITYNGTTFIVNDDADLSGSTIFGRNDTGVHLTTHQFSGSIYVADDKSIVFGANEDASIFYDEASTDRLVVTGAVDINMPDNTAIAFTINEAENQYVSIVTSNSNELIALGQNVQIADDKKLYFGTGNDASFEYDEDGTDTLTYAGANMLFNSSLNVSGSTVFGRSDTGVHLTTHVFSGSMYVADDKAIVFGANEDASIHYDEANTNRLVVTGAVDIDMPDNTGVAFAIGEAENSYVTVITTNSSEAVMLSQDAWIIDDTKLYFGTNKDAHVEYDEDGSDMLIVSGAFLGTQITGAVHFGGGDGHLYIADDKKLYFGNNDDTSVHYDEASTNRLVVTGAVDIDMPDNTPIAFAIGEAENAYVTVVTTNSSEAVMLSQDAWIIDDKKLYFGTGKDAHIEYDEDGNDTAVLGGTNWQVLDDKKLYFGDGLDSYIEYNEDYDNFMVISGSSQGVALSGSTVGVNGNVAINYGVPPKVSLTVAHDYQTTAFEAQLTGSEGGGEILKYSPGADDDLTAGQLYYLHTDGTWNQTDADAVATGASQLLGIGRGNARSLGVVIKGFVRIPSTEILNLPGSGACDGLPVYVSTTAGHLDFTAPSGTGDFVRIVGYAIDDHEGNVLIYFDPDKTWVEVA